MTKDQLAKLTKAAKAASQAAIELSELAYMLRDEEPIDRYWVLSAMSENHIRDSQYLNLLSHSLE
ncbi:hypothetical protein LCGC14_0842240 [marine sediment metagenome]|uniref:Uncharacterized protein n=1 Tax=marine sediment metagenome TaxID=412755 RepID=A0A0F9PCQ1_9ZZZZ